MNRIEINCTTGEVVEIALTPAEILALTDAEAARVAAILPPTPLQEIATIEQSNPITHRNLRDLSMTVAQIAAAVTGTAPMTNPAVREIAALTAQIDALRAQAKAEGLLP